MWVVLMYTKGGAQYEYTVIPESMNPTRDEIVGCAVQSHTLNCLSGIVPTYKDGRNDIREIIIMTSVQEFSQYWAVDRPCCPDPTCACNKVNAAGYCDCIRWA